MEIWIALAPTCPSIPADISATYIGFQLYTRFMGKWWSKAWYLRFKDIFLYIHEHEPVACDVRKEGNDLDWSMVMSNFQAEEDPENKLKSMTSLWT